MATITMNTTLNKPVITKSTIGSANAVTNPRMLFQIRMGDLNRQKAKNTAVHKRIAMCRAFKS